MDECAHSALVVSLKQLAAWAALTVVNIISCCEGASRKSPPCGLAHCSCSWPTVSLTKQYCTSNDERTNVRLASAKLKLNRIKIVNLFPLPILQPSPRSPYPIRSYYPMNLIPFRCRTSTFSQSFFLSTILLWNSLPSSLKETLSPTFFLPSLVLLFMTLISSFIRSQISYIIHYTSSLSWYVYYYAHSLFKLEFYRTHTLCALYISTVSTDCTVAIF